MWHVPCLRATVSDVTSTPCFLCRQSLGNHEFDDGLPGLLPFLQAVRAPVVAANLDLSATPGMRLFVNPSTVVTVDGVKIGIIGYITPDTVVNVN